MTVNNAFGGRKPMLTVIDGAAWLGVLLIIGGIVGAWGSLNQPTNAPPKVGHAAPCRLRERPSHNGRNDEQTGARGVTGGRGGSAMSDKDL